MRITSRGSRAFVTPLVLATIAVAAWSGSAAAGAAGAGSRWEVVDSSHFGTLMALSAVSPDDMWTVGTYYDQPSGRELPLTEHWNGKRFVTVTAPPASAGYNGFQGVAAIAHGDVWAVGYQGEQYDYYHRFPLIEHWNGTRWRVVKSPFRGEGELTGIAALSANDVWAVGFRSANPYGSLILHWNGGSWSIVDDGHPTDNTWLRGVVALGPDNLWAGGATQENGDVVAFAEHWNGFKWTDHVALPGAEYDEFNAIAADAVDGSVWGVGWQTPGLGYFMMAQSWDGSSWTMRPPPDWSDSNNNLYGVYADGGRAWAVGYGAEQGFNPLVLRWANGGWHVEELPVSGYLRLLAIARVGSSLWTVGEGLIMRRHI
jgi:hypothetical protein